MMITLLHAGMFPSTFQPEKNMKVLPISLTRLLQRRGYSLALSSSSDPTKDNLLLVYDLAPIIIPVLTLPPEEFCYSGL